MTTLNPAEARTLWKALMDNATALIRDAHLLLDAGSQGRARALTVLAQEELGKAIWIYDVFQLAWNDEDPTPREVPKLKEHGRSHVQKFMEASSYGDELGPFWGDYSAYDGLDTQEDYDRLFERQRVEAKAAAKAANVAKQAGFYVDYDEATGTIRSPSEVDVETIAEDLQVAAQVIEMLLIRDHSRMKHDAVTPYDSTHEQQYRLLPVSHPEDWAAALDAFKEGGPPDFTDADVREVRREMGDGVGDDLTG